MVFITIGIVLIHVKNKTLCRDGDKTISPTNLTNTFQMTAGSGPGGQPGSGALYERVRQTDDLALQQQQQPYSESACCVGCNPFKTANFTTVFYNHRTRSSKSN